jgi:hypothetical protein
MWVTGEPFAGEVHLPVAVFSVVPYIGEYIPDLGGKFSGSEILVHVSLRLRIFGNTRIRW